MATREFRAQTKHESREIVLRKGKWTAEEENYANKIIDLFNQGMLPIVAGTTLRTYLSDKLRCDPMRITKKFAGASCIGKQVFTPCDDYNLNFAAIQENEFELQRLETLFLMRINAKSGSSGLSSSSKRGTVSSLLDAGGQFTSKYETVGYEGSSGGAGGGAGGRDSAPNSNQKKISGSGGNRTSGRKSASTVGAGSSAPSPARKKGRAARTSTTSSSKASSSKVRNTRGYAKEDYGSNDSDDGRDDGEEDDDIDSGEEEDENNDYDNNNNNGFSANYDFNNYNHYTAAAATAVAMAAANGYAGYGGLAGYQAALAQQQQQAMNYCGDDDYADDDEDDEEEDDDDDGYHFSSSADGVNGGIGNRIQDGAQLTKTAGSGSGMRVGYDEDYDEQYTTGETPPHRTNSTASSVRSGIKTMDASGDPKDSSSPMLASSNVLASESAFMRGSLGAGKRVFSAPNLTELNLSQWKERSYNPLPADSLKEMFSQPAGFGGGSNSLKIPSSGDKTSNMVSRSDREASSSSSSSSSSAHAPGDSFYRSLMNSYAQSRRMNSKSNGLGLGLGGVMMGGGSVIANASLKARKRSHSVMALMDFEKLAGDDCAAGDLFVQFLDKIKTSNPKVEVGSVGNARAVAAAAEKSQPDKSVSTVSGSNNSAADAPDPGDAGAAGGLPFPTKRVSTPSSADGYRSSMDVIEEQQEEEDPPPSQSGATTGTSPTSSAIGNGDHKLHTVALANSTPEAQQSLDIQQKTAEEDGNFF